MLFNSYEFIFAFLPITFFIYFYLNHKRLTEASKGFLVFSSLFFYSWWNIAYLPVILSSMLFNYIVGNSLNNEEGHHRFSKKSILTFGIISNIALLGYFKYADFMIENFNLALDSDTELLHLALPLAISFFTFQQIAFLVDSYRQETKEYDFLNYSLFVTFFPQLIAGPIVHHSEMMPQFAKTKNKVKNHRNIAMGLFIFSIGLFKKVVIADTFAVWATQGFDVATTLNLFEAWATSLSYTFQLYFDFSGYTDMAIGIALLFNIKLPINFNSPYKSTSIIELWQRWHITLSKFVSKYIHTPLVMSYGRVTIHKTMVMTFITFLIVGLWHGASWKFVFWGALHGLALVINYYWRRLIMYRMPEALGWFLTFNFFNFALVFFRAKEWDDAVKVLGSMSSFDNIVLPNQLAEKLTFLSSYGVKFGDFSTNLSTGIDLIVWLVIGFILILLFKNSIQLLNQFKTNLYYILFTILTFYISFFHIQRYSEFIYFQF